MGRDAQAARDVLTWLLAGRESTRSGVMYYRPFAIAQDLGRTVRAVDDALARLAALGHVVLSPEAQTLFVPDAIFTNPPSNLSHATSLRREIAAFKSCLASEQALEIIGRAIDTVSHRVPDTVPDTRVQITGSRKQITGNSVLSPPAPAPAAPDLFGNEGGGKSPLPLKQGPDWQRLIAEYNSRCPSLARCEGKPTSAAAKSAASALKREPDFASWCSRFDAAEASDFLAGRSGSFKADFLWLIVGVNAEKIDAGRYTNRGATNRTARQPPGCAPTEVTGENEISF